MSKATRVTKQKLLEYYSDSVNNYNKLVTEFNSLDSRHNELNLKHNRLVNLYNTLLAEYYKTKDKCCGTCYLERLHNYHYFCKGCKDCL
jgi:hypothetical protein